MSDDSTQNSVSEALEMSTSGADEETAVKEHGMNAANVRYEGGVCVYTDPETSFQYQWDVAKNEWIPRNNIVENKVADNTDQLKTETLHSNDEESNSSVPSEDYHFDGETYLYKDRQSGVTYKYDTNQKSWIVKDESASGISVHEEKEPEKTESEKKEEKSKKEEEKAESDSDSEKEEELPAQPVKQDMTKGTYGFEGDTHTYTDSTDGSVYMWDREKNAWFPKLDEEFLARYQLSYGFTEPEKPPEKSVEEEVKEIEDADKAKQEALKRKAAPQEPSWFELDEQHNTKVYVSNLPLDITEEEFVDVMQKCGLIMRDVDTGKMKVKLYADPVTGDLKGDGLCTYIKIESVELALQLLDGYDLRGHKLSIERARFQMKGEYDPSRKPKRRRKKDKDKIKKMQEKLFAWQPDKLRGERAKHERVVIIKNLFEPNLFDKEVSLLLEYQQELREECQKCGDVRRVVIYDRHPEGVAQVTFKESEEADACIQLLNGRWYNQRKITAETWDGKTKYKVKETEEERQKRLKKWEQFLESEENKKTSEKKDHSGNVNVASSANETDGKTPSKAATGETDEKNCVTNENINKIKEAQGSCGESDADTEDENEENSNKGASDGCNK